MCSTTNILPLNSVNWVAFPETMESGPPNLANSLCRNPITIPVVGFLLLNISSHLEKLQPSNMNQLSRYAHVIMSGQFLSMG